jgi:hypothetical protein
MSRLGAWIKMHSDAGMTEYEIACGLDNGDIDRPEWLASGQTALGYTLWDTDNSDGTDNLYELDTNNA